MHWSFSFWLHLMNIGISDLCVCTKVRASEHMFNVSLAPKEYIFQKTEIRTAQGCFYSNGNVCHPNRYIKLTLLMDHSIGFLVNLYATNCQSVRNFGLFATTPVRPVNQFKRNINSNGFDWINSMKSCYSTVHVSMH